MENASNRDLNCRADVLEANGAGNKASWLRFAFEKKTAEIERFFEGFSQNKKGA
jgi:hypothetical protein